MTSLFARSLTITRHVGQTLCALILIKDYIAEAAICEGESMLPTFKSKGETILVEKISVATKAIKRGDVIIAVSPNDPDKLICKRIIAMAGDCVTSLDGFMQIPKGHVWIEGDNPRRSLDSRSFGPLPYGLVHGKVICKIWPLSEFGRRV